MLLKKNSISAIKEDADIGAEQLIDASRLKTAANKYINPALKIH